MPKVGMPEIRKSQLIQATIEAINDVGLHKASVAMIGRYAGVSPSIINHYFGGKDSLLEETMRSILKDLSAAITYCLFLRGCRKLPKLYDRDNYSLN